MPTDAPQSDVDRLRTDAAAWDEFVRTTPGGGYLQLTGWAAVKAANGWRARRVVADAGSGPIGVQLLIRRLGPTPFGVGYCPRGPGRAERCAQPRRADRTAGAGRTPGAPEPHHDGPGLGSTCPTEPSAVTPSIVGGPSPHPCRRAAGGGLAAE